MSIKPLVDTPVPEKIAVARALISVSDKTGLLAFAAGLVELGVEILSTGGTARALREAGLPVTEVSDLTRFPEILDGRVKTLHPAIHGGILARRTESHLQELEAHGIRPIDLVVVNLYPFEQQVARPGLTEAEAIEYIDIGGPTLIRAAAKNFYYVGVVTRPEQYEEVLEALRVEGGLPLPLRRRLAAEAFARTAAYDAAIARYFARGEQDLLPETLHLQLPRRLALRYGENPHQPAALYGLTDRYFEKLHGKELSYNNLLDIHAALHLIEEFSDYGPTCAIFKHTNPCGVATADTLLAAYQRAFATDTRSPFGGIVVVNRPLDMATAEAIDRVFTEVIIAPAFEDGVLDFLRRKKNRRIIRRLASLRDLEGPEFRSFLDGLLAQGRDPFFPAPEELRQHFRVVTQRAPTEAEWKDLDFAWRVVKWVKSNAIVYARQGATLGIGAGQMSRVDAAEIAVWKGRREGHDFTGSVVASDAFFPFPDGVEAAAEAGATAVIQPGGSIRDEEVIAAADRLGLAMVFTGQRHFKH